MKALLVAIALLSLTTPGRAQALEQPKAGAEQKKLEIFVGDWTFEGVAHDTPLGPGGKFTGKVTHRWILNGFVLEERWKDTSVENGYIPEGLVLRWYDPHAKVYRQQEFEGDGSVTPCTVTIDGNKWITRGTRFDRSGRSFPVKLSYFFSPDGNSTTNTAEYSADDGKTWLPWWSMVARKVR